MVSQDCLLYVMFRFQRVLYSRAYKESVLYILNMLFNCWKVAGECKKKFKLMQKDLKRFYEKAFKG